MKFGVFDHMDRSSPSLADQFEQRLKLVELYDRYDFHAYHVAEHHSTPLGMAPSPSVWLAAVAQRTRRLRFGPLVYTLSLYHPLRLIDEICMLDQMSGGRLELGVGRGISPYEVGYFGVDPETGKERFEECLSVLLHGLTHATVDFSGKFFTFKAVPVELQPVQRPYPPLWYGANTPDHATRLAKDGINAVVGLRPVGVRSFVERYRSQWREHGRDEKGLPLIGMSRHIVVAPTDREASDIARRGFLLWYDALLHLWRHNGVGLPRQLIPAEFEDAVAGGYIVCGTPATVRDRMRFDNEVAGINYCLCRMAFGDLSYDEAAQSVELFAREVMPAL